MTHGIRTTHPQHSPTAEEKAAAALLAKGRARDASQAAAIVAAGTALVLAPVDPAVFRPAAPVPAPTVPGCTAILLAHATLRAQADTTARVRAHLGYHPAWTPRAHLGETSRRIQAWDQRELNALHERLGGEVTAREVTRTAGRTTWTATEITLTVDVPGVGPVTVSTDWDEESGGHDLPLARGLALPTVTV
ncbi:hypothetical protein [Streptomyces tagetis]|uniref:Uncharacterized protein n=1 Tax=Streptomyces tagetis TaxID=2820809 RepID=A0A940XG19_9ACTN|nr:hypothetical protein [Streptomyces sp. RG38]MBQ0827686.1 hypothetical protein [Streptomyces sp. RG38]